MPAMVNESEPLLTAYHFNYTQRPRRDKAWAVAYYLLLLLTLGWALTNLVMRPDLLSVLSSPDYLDDSDHCPVQSKPPPSDIANLVTHAVAAAREALVPAARRRATQLPRLDLASPFPTHSTHSVALTLHSNPTNTTDPTNPHSQQQSELQSVITRGSQDPVDSIRQASDLQALGEPAGELISPGAASGGRSITPEDGRLPRVILDYGGLLLLISLASALALAVLFVAALRHSPWALVLLACGLQVGAPLASAVVASRAGNSSVALLLLLSSTIVALSLYWGREGLQLVCRLLGLAAIALRDNPALLGLLVVLKIALTCATVLLLASAAVVAAAGNVVPNPLRAGRQDCTDPGGQRVTCCALAPSATLPIFLPAAATTLAWTLLLMFELKVFVVSGVMAQWYFSPAGHLAGGGYREQQREEGAGIGGPRGGMPDGLSDGGGVGLQWGSGGGGYSSSRALMASLGHALGPSFGSLCAASGVLGATAHVRTVVNGIMSRSRRFAALRASPEASSASPFSLTCCCCCGPLGLLHCAAWLLGCCCCCCVALLEQLTKFATVQMAMTGLGFWRASREVVTLLRRNFMDAYNMWWYMPMILHCGAAAFAAAWGYAAYWLARQCWAPFTHAAPLSFAASASLGALAAATAELVLSFVCSVLVNIADALFVCFVLDRDSAAVTWYDLHCVFASLPCCVEARAAAEAHYASHCGSSSAAAASTGYSSVAVPLSYYYVPPATAYGGSYTLYGYPTPAGLAMGSTAQLGQPIGYWNQQQRPQYVSAYGGGGFWGWLRSPGASGSGMYGMPVDGSRYRNDRPQYPPPAVLSPPYSDHRFPVLVPSPMGPPPPPPYFGSPPMSVRPS